MNIIGPECAVSAVGVAPFHHWCIAFVYAPSTAGVWPCTLPPFATAVWLLNDADTERV